MRDRSLAGQEALERVPAEYQHHLRLEELELSLQVGLAGLGLVGHRVTVLRWAAFQDVGDVDVGAAEPDTAEQRVEQLAGGADERLALPVLVEARRFAHDHHVGRTRTHARNRLGAGRVQAAFGAAPHLGMKNRQLEGGGGHHRRKIRRSRWPRFGRSDEQRSERIGQTA